MLSKDLIYSFLVVFLSGFDRLMVVSKNDLGNIHSFVKSLKRFSVNSSLNIWTNSPMKPYGLGLFFVERFDY